ncbi:MAG TPA: hypothetical protein VF623_02685 [Segetibacter sp.]|jgi:hypothetical protein
MSTLVKNVRERNIVEFDNGTFDNWCVYLTRGGEIRYAPKDTEYFAILKSFGKRYGNKKLYEDFVAFYEPTSKTINPAVLNQITILADKYTPDAEELDIWFTVIYAGMVAEENKAFAILKKRIKRLGLHQVLMEGMPVHDAAHYSRGKKWRDLDIEMWQRGF